MCNIINHYIYYKINTEVNISLMKIVIAGVGYVGLISGLGLAKLDNKIQFLDIDSNKINKLKNNELPFYEPGLKELLVAPDVHNNITFHDSYSEIDWIDLDIFMICVQTPSTTDGSLDTSFMNNVFSDLNLHLKNNTIVCIKSTIHPSAVDSFLESSDIKSEKIVFNPEFLREGSAIDDFFNPDRIVIGSDDIENAQKISMLYEHFPSEILFTDPISSQLIKYLANTYLPLRLSFANEASQLVSTMGGTLSDVLKGIGLDNRIGQNYLRPSPGWGGSCFPKDLNEIQNLADNNSLNLPIIKNISESNNIHMEWFGNQLIEIKKEKKLQQIILLGASFKENTDDIRHSPTLSIYKNLKVLGEKVYIYDQYIELDGDFDKSTNFEDNTLYVEMFPISDAVFNEYKEKLSEYENVYYFRFWEEALDI